MLFQRHLWNVTAEWNITKDLIYSSLSLALFMAVVDQFLLIIYKLISHALDSIYSISLYEQIYSIKLTGIGSLGQNITGCLFDFIVYLLILEIGYLIRLVYYRINKMGRIIISVSVPVCISILLPVIDSLVLHGRISALLTKLINAAYGISAYHPGNAILTNILLFLLIGSLSWLLIRRAPIKE